MKVNELAEELLNYKDEDGYCDAFIEDGKLIVKYGSKDLILLEDKKEGSKTQTWVECPSCGYDEYSVEEERCWNCGLNWD